MNSLLENKLITTKHASNLSGYTSDYLALLARSGKIKGQRMGRNWLIDIESLNQFLDQQYDRKSNYSRLLAKERVEEYRAHQSSLHNLEKPLLKPTPDSKSHTQQINLPTHLFRSQALAVSVASLVLVSGAYVAQASPLSHISETVIAFAQNIPSGFDEAFGNIPTQIAVEIGTVGDAMRSQTSRVVKASTKNAYVFAPSLSHKIAFLQTNLARNYYTQSIASQSVGAVFMAQPILSTKDIIVRLGNVATLISSPLRVVNAFANAYIVLGTSVYGAVNNSFTAYRSLIDSAGSGALSVATQVRDTVVFVPNTLLIVSANLGKVIVDTTHFAIRADVALVNILATGAPSTARAITKTIGTVGGILAFRASQAPEFATYAFLNVTALPATLAPHIASSIFNVEYAGALRFIAATNKARDSYLALINTTGDTVYTGTTGALAIARITTSALVTSPYNIGHLGILGNIALTQFDTTVSSFTHIQILLPQIAGVAAAVSLSPTTRSVGEEAVVVVYDFIQPFFDKTYSTFVTLFSSTPENTAPHKVQLAKSIQTATTSPKNEKYKSNPVLPQAITQNVKSYPTYKTVVQ